jgi:hypothetical protein
MPGLSGPELQAHLAKPAAGAENISSTNLHTHGLIVSPKNASSNMPQNGDNVFVTLGRGQSLDYKIDIPTELPASMLDGTVLGGCGCLNRISASISGASAGVRPPRGKAAS